MARKTFAIEPFRQMLNRRIGHPDTDVAARQALCMVLESVLHEAGRYHGYRYLDGWHGTEEYRHEYH